MCENMLVVNITGVKRNLSRSSTAIVLASGFFKEAIANMEMVVDNARVCSLNVTSKELSSHYVVQGGPWER